MNNEGNNKIPNTKETVKDNPQIKITEPTIFRIKTKYVGTTSMVLTWYKHFTRNGGLNQSKIRNLYTVNIQICAVLEYSTCFSFGSALQHLITLIS